jgi:hypothetical protein
MNPKRWLVRTLYALNHSGKLLCWGRGQYLQKIVITIKIAKGFLD